MLGFGNIDPIPFRWEQGVYDQLETAPNPAFQNGVPLSLRAD